MSVVIETTLGDFTVDLFIEERPQTCKNFLKLCKIKYYNFCLFHSIQANFIAQTGDPTGIGTGGESVYGLVYGEESKYYEAEKIPKIKHNKPGLLSMVNYGNNTLGSQFFLTLGTELKSLEEHCVFAEVTEGLDILVKLNDAICDGQHRPYQDIRITHTVILEDPFEDIPGLVVPDASPDITSVEIANGRIGADEKINDEDGLSEVQLQELKEEREAKARATILEIVGDLPHADVAPPENVLFVCKLNPVTTDEELEIIFNRFGKVKSCEVIRDHQTGDSLQYAFVEFEDQKSCEQAYLKMDNVLIDDRRIHVDFSQSVSRIKWKGKGRGVQYFDKPDEKESNSTRSSERHFFNKREYYSRDRGDNRGERQERDRDRNDRRREDDRRRRGGGGDREQEEYRRRDRRKMEESSRRRGEEEGWREEDDSRKRRDTRDERRREEERKYGGSGSSNSRRDDRRREEDKRREVEKRRNGTEKKDTSSSSRRENHMEERRMRAEEKNKEEVKEYRDEVKYETARPRDKERISSRETAKKTEHELSNHSSSYKKEETVATVSNNVEASNSQNNASLDITPNENNIDLTMTPEKASTSDPKKVKKKKKKKPSSSSESSSSESSESSSSSSSEQRRKKKRSLTVAKKYYNHRGKVYKIVKKKKNESSTESSEESSDCDTKRRKKVKYKKIVKVIKKRRRTTTDEESDTDSSSSDDSEESDRPRKKKKKAEKNSKKKRKESKKDTKKKKRRGSSDSSKSEEKSSKKKNKMAAETSKKSDDKFE